MRTPMSMEQVAATYGQPDGHSPCGEHGVEHAEWCLGCRALRRQLERKQWRGRQREAWRRVRARLGGAE